MDEKEKLTAQIVADELEMFLAVPADGIYTCQLHPESFRHHRCAQFSAWSMETLISYADDLERAKRLGLNLMTVKYARMDNLLPKENVNPLIEEIVEMQIRWQQELNKKYPRLMAGTRPLSGTKNMSATTTFDTYLKSELETYSDRTLELLHQDMQKFEEMGVNALEKIYEYLCNGVSLKDIPVGLSGRGLPAKAVPNHLEDDE